MYKGKSIAIVVPAFNESRFIEETLNSVPSYVDKIYAVDDASSDSTRSIMLEKAQRDSRLEVIIHEVNGGVGASITSGYEKALGDEIDIVAVMAGDGQMDSRFLTNLLDPIVEGKAEYTKGNRLFTRDLRRGMSSWRFFGNVVLTYMNKIVSGYWGIVDPQNGYTAITGRALSLLNLDHIYPRYAFENDMLVRLNIHYIKVVNVPIPARYGEEKSKISYGSFILKTLAFFMRAFCWRIWHKYIARAGKMRARSQTLHVGHTSPLSSTAVDADADARVTPEFNSHSLVNPVPTDELIGHEDDTELCQGRGPE